MVARNRTRNGDTAGLSPVQERVIALLAGGAAITRAAEQAGVGRRTVHDWLQRDAEFVAALNEAKDEVRDRMRADRDVLVIEATATLRALMASGNPPAVRLRAATSVLSVFGRPSPPTVGPTDPEDVRAAWKAAEERRERERAESAMWSWIDSIPLER